MSGLRRERLFHRRSKFLARAFALFDRAGRAFGRSLAQNRIPSGRIAVLGGAILLAIVGYGIVAALTAYLAGRISGDGDLAGFAIFWPLFIPVATSFWLGDVGARCRRKRR